LIVIESKTLPCVPVMQRVKREMRINPVGSRCLWAQILREWGHPLPICWYRSMGSWLRYNFADGSFQTTKLCSRLL